MNTIFLYGFHELIAIFSFIFRFLSQELGAARSANPVAQAPLGQQPMRMHAEYPHKQ